jgi:AAHS family 4-hydroxybenzoate transporter-like MFS transporter
MKESSGVSADVLEIKTAVNGQKFNRFTLNIAVLSFIILILDGYDMLSISFIIPALAKEWNLNPGQFGPVLALGNFGLMIGAAIFGYVGDKYGRKTSVIISTLVFSVFSFACAFSTHFSNLLVFRVLAAIGIGGLQPAIFVLNSDYAPQQSKMKRVSMLFAGANIGSGLAGLTTAKVLPIFGWQSVFIIGGIAPLIFALILAIWLPESVSWLAANNKSRSKIAALMKKLRPDLTVTPDTRFINARGEEGEKTSMKHLFTGRLAAITPLLWLNFIIASFIMLFTASWMPTLFVAQGLSMSKAAGLTAIAPLAGIIGSVLVGLFLDKAGFKWGAIVPAAAFICIAPFGLMGIHGPLIPMVALIGICVAANYAIMPAFVPLFYPVNNRTNASGVALAVSKIGSIIAPLLGGILIAGHVSVERIYFIAALPMIVGTILIFVLAHLYQKYFSPRA